MTVCYKCDGPSREKVLTNDDTRFDLGLTRQAEPLEEGEFTQLESIHLGFLGDYHFCSPDCLASWAMDRAIRPELLG